MKAIIVLLCLFVVGCASSTRPARDYAEKGLTVSAYTQLTTELHNNRKGDRPYASALVAEFPDLRTYGSGLFTEAALTEWAATHSDMYWIQYRLTTFCATNSPEDCEAAIQRVKDAEKKIKPPKPWLSTTKELVEQQPGIRWSMSGVKPPWQGCESRVMALPFTVPLQQN